jgi:hypothetical protein
MLYLISRKKKTKEKVYYTSSQNVNSLSAWRRTKYLSMAWIHPLRQGNILIDFDLNIRPNQSINPYGKTMQVIHMKNI